MTDSSERTRAGSGPGTGDDHSPRERVAHALTRYGRPLIIAHRGAMAHHPENTIASFRRAVREGADAVETDLHVTRDGAFVCLHDRTLERTTDGAGAVEKKSLDEVRLLVAGDPSPAHGDGDRVPTLAEFVEAVPAPAILALELKSKLFRDRAVCRALLAELDRTASRGRAMVLSFDLRRLRIFRSIAPDVATGLVSLTRLWPVAEVEVLGPFWPILFLNPFFVFVAHRRGQAVCPLDAHSERRIWLYRALGCDALLSEDPAGMRRLLEAKPRGTTTAR